MSATDPAAVRIDGGGIAFGSRTLVRDLDLEVRPGEMLAVLGPNGSGKSTLLRAILGLQHLDAGTVEVLGAPARRGDRRIGYIPQQRIFAPGTPLRGGDLIRLGIDGHRFGLPLARRGVRARVDELADRMRVGHLRDRAIGELSGGEQQRFRVAQALAGDPDLLLCDEPLLSLDLPGQALVADRLADARSRGAAVIFVTHDINPVLDHVDRVLYLAEGGYRLGSPDEVLRDDVLSVLYRSPVHVLHVDGRVVVVGGRESASHHHVAPSGVDG